MSNLVVHYRWQEKMTRAGLIYILIMGLVGCREERPAGVLSGEEYAALLVDIYLGEAKLNGYGVTRDSAMKLYDPFQASVLRRRGLQDSIVKKTYQYYINHPRELEEVYTAVIDTLNLREQRSATLQPIPQ